jgi:uncharacterized membrane protein (DUF485 family)
MQPDVVAKVKNNPKYVELVTKRSRFAWILTILMLIIYYGFIIIVAFDKEFLGTPLSEGMITTRGIPLGVFVIVSAFVLTGIYVWRANSTFDQLTKQIKEDIK